MKYPMNTSSSFAFTSRVWCQAAAHAAYEGTANGEGESSIVYPPPQPGR